MTLRYTLRMHRGVSDSWNFSKLTYEEALGKIVQTSLINNASAQDLLGSVKPGDQGMGRTFGAINVFVATEDVPETAEEKVAALKALFHKPFPKNSFYLNGFPDQYETLNEFMDTDYGTKIKKILEGE